MKLPKPSLPAVLVLFAVAAEVGLSGLVGLNPGEAFAWYRVVAHVRPGGFLLIGILVALAVLVGPRPERAGPGGLAIGALVVHLLLWDVPQGQPDTANWFVLAQRMERAPLGSLLHWKSLVWDTPQGAYHHYLPLVPSLFGLAFRLFGESPLVAGLVMTALSVALPLAVAWVGREAGEPETGVMAGWLTLGVPFAQVQTGWMLADLPLCVILCLAWASLLRAVRTRARLDVAIALAATVLALLTKSSAALFIPVLWAAALVRDMRLLVLTGLLSTVVLLLIHPLRMEAPLGIVFTMLAVILQLRPSLWAGSLGRLRTRDALDRTVVAMMAVLVALVLMRMSRHIPRYALPIIPAIALGTARSFRALPRARAAILASGLGLLVLGYRPLVVISQAKNLQVACRRIEAMGVSAVEVWGDHPDTTFPVSAITALVDYYVSVPVRYGGVLHERTSTIPGWWTWYEPPPWHATGGPADGVLLSLYGAEATEFLAQHPDLEVVDTVSLYRRSSHLFPQSVLVLRRNAGSN